MEIRECHCLGAGELESQLSTHLEKGLSQEEAQERLKKYGPNELQEKPRPGFLQMLLAQFNNFLVMILIVAAVVSLLLGEYRGRHRHHRHRHFERGGRRGPGIQGGGGPGRPEEDGRPQCPGHPRRPPGDHSLAGARAPETSSSSKPGTTFPRTCASIESVNLKVEEASLTGESVPVEKNANVVLDKEIPLGDRKNSAFMSTLVTYGRGRGLVTATGMHTQIGLIAEMLQSYEEEADAAPAKAGSAGQDPGHRLPGHLRDHLYIRPDPGHPSGHDLQGRVHGLSQRRKEGHRRPLHDRGKPGDCRRARRACRRWSRSVWLSACSG